MSLQIRIIQADGREGLINVSKISSDALRTIVGGWLEFVSVLDEESGRPYSMVVNETGVIDKLPRNQKATDIYLAYSRRRFPNKDHSSGPYIAGDVVVIPVATLRLDDVIV